MTRGRQCYRQETGQKLLARQETRRESSGGGYNPKRAADSQGTYNESIVQETGNSRQKWSHITLMRVSCTAFCLTEDKMQQWSWRSEKGREEPGGKLGCFISVYFYTVIFFQYQNW